MQPGVRFTSARFAASLSDMRFTPQGDVKITLVAPFAERARAVLLMDAIGLQLEVKVERKVRGA